MWAKNHNSLMARRLRSVLVSQAFMDTASGALGVICPSVAEQNYFGPGTILISDLYLPFWRAVVYPTVGNVNGELILQLHGSTNSGNCRVIPRMYDAVSGQELTSVAGYYVTVTTSQGFFECAVAKPLTPDGVRIELFATTPMVGADLKVTGNVLDAGSDFIITAGFGGSGVNTFCYFPSDATIQPRLVIRGEQQSTGNWKHWVAPSFNKTPIAATSGGTPDTVNFRSSDVVNLKTVTIYEQRSTGFTSGYGALP